MRKTSVVGTASALNGSDVATRMAIVERTIASVYARPKHRESQRGYRPRVAEPGRRCQQQRAKEPDDRELGRACLLLAISAERRTR